MEIKVNSENVKYTKDYIEAKYDYQFTKVDTDGNKITVSRSFPELSSLYALEILVHCQCQNLELELD